MMNIYSSLVFWAISVNISRNLMDENIYVNKASMRDILILNTDVLDTELKKF